MPRVLTLLALLLVCLAGAEVLAQPAPAGVAAYGAPPAAFTPPAELARVYEACAREAAARGRSLRPDGATAATAMLLAQSLVGETQHRPLAYTAGRTVTNAAGQTDHDVVWQTWWVPEGAAAPDYAAAVRSMLGSTSNLRYEALGVGHANSRGESVWVVALALRAASLTEPLARTVRPGATVRLRVRLAEGYSEPWLDLTAPDGRVTVHRAGPGPVLAFDLPLATAGSWQVELSARGPAGPRPALNVFVYADATPPPLSFQRSGTPDPPEQIERELLRMINDTRTRAGLAPVRLDARLTAVARAHSQDMAQNHFEGHDSPRSGTPSDRVRRAGVRTNLVLENVDGGFSASDIHESFLSSPGHRATLLDPRVTDVGIGVVLQRNEGGDAAMATEDFIHVQPAVNSEALPAAALAAINARRSARGLPPLAAHAALGRFAQGLAGEYFRGAQTVAQLQELARTRLEGAGIPYVQSMVQALSPSSAEELAENDWLLGRELDALGVAFVQGNRADLPPNALVAVLVGVQTALAPVDTAALAERLRGLVDAQRREGGAPALTRDAQLDRFAQQTAQRFFQGTEAASAVQDRARTEVLTQAGRVTRAMVLAVTTANPDSLATGAWLRQRELTVGALAVAQGTRPDTLRNQLFVVLVLVSR